MEWQLQSIPTVIEPQPIPFLEPQTRITHGLKIGSKYKDLMSKSRREEVEKASLLDVNEQPEVIESEVYSCLDDDSNLS
jgi:hypothetical protein